MNNTDIVFYGERGVVNGIILDIKDDLEKQKVFLKSIKFAEGDIDWIDNLTSVKWFVELSFSEFGDPDLILSVKTKDEKKFVFIIEAKLAGYNESSENIDETKLLPTDYKSNTSRLNIQLALKYRLLNAYQDFTKGKKDFIYEPMKIGSDYNDRRRKGRRIKNSIVIDYCNDLFAKVEETYYVALTHDNKDIKPYETRSCLPAIGADNWERDKKLFGLVTYDMLESVVWNNSKDEQIKGIIAKDKGYYGTAAKKLDTKAPVLHGDSKYDPLPRTKNINKWSDEQIRLANYANKYIEAGSSSGSYSRVIGNITALKITADNKDKHQILICFSQDGLPSEFKGNYNGKTYMIGIGQKRKPFYCCPIGNKKELKTMRSFIRDFISRYEVKMGVV